MVTMICGSPNMKNSNTLYILNGLKAMLKSEAEIYRTKSNEADARSAVLTAAKSDQSLVFAFPLYADQLPSDLLKFLYELEPQLKEINTHSRVYVIVQNGFYDKTQNRLAVLIVKKWCEKCGLVFARALMIGAGGMTQAAPIGKGPSAPVGKALAELAESIDSGTAGEIISAAPLFPRFLYKLAGNMGFTMQGRENGLTKNDIKAKPAEM